MSERYTKEQLLDVWRRDMDPSYTEPLETEDSGRGLDVISGLAAVLERASTAVLNTTQALYLKPHSTQLAPPASGNVVATGQVEIHRGIIVGGPLPLVDGDQIIAQFFGVNGEDEDAPVFEVVGSPVIPSGTEGPTLVDVRCSRPGFQGNVRPGTEGKFPDKRGGTFAVVSHAAGLITIDPANGDRFVPTMSGMLWRFTSGLNLGAYARRITVLTDSTATIADFATLAAQGAGTGEAVDFQTVIDARIVFVDGTEGGRSAELDMLSRERTTIGRAIGESDDAFRDRVTVLPETVSPNAIIRAIQAVLEPLGIPFQFIEVFDQGVGFFFDDGTHVVDCAFSDPFAYRNKSFYVGASSSSGTPIGFLVVVNALALPPEPDLTAVLAALTTTIVGSKGGGVPWAVAIEPPSPIVFVDPLAGVARDALSLVYRPATLAQWQTVFDVAAIPITLVQANTWVWLCDEAAGNLVDEINGLALVPNAAPAYQQVVAGQAALAVKTTDNTANQRFATTDASLPDVLNTNAILLTYVDFDAIGAVRGVASLGTTRIGARHTTVSPRLVCNATTTSGAAAVGTTQTRPWLLMHDETNSIQELATDQERVTGAPFDGGVTGKQLQIGATDAAPATANYSYIALFKGIVLTTPQRKALLQTLGYAIPW